MERQLVVDLNKSCCGDTCPLQQFEGGLFTFTTAPGRGEVWWLDQEDAHRCLYNARPVQNDGTVLFDAEVEDEMLWSDRMVMAVPAGMIENLRFEEDRYPEDQKLCNNIKSGGAITLPGDPF